MSRLARHALTYFATAGVLLLAVSGILLITLVSKYNRARVLDVPHAAAMAFALAFGQTLLVSGAVTYAMSRKGYTPPPIPPLPQAETVALIPAFNEEGSVGAVVEEARKHVGLVIVVDDGSTDRTAEEARRAGAIVVQHPRNMGYGAAVKTLMKAALAAGAKYAVLLDADGQHDPRDIPKFLQALKNGADIAVGNRFAQSKVPLHRKIGIYAIRALLRLLGAKAGDPENGYRAFTRKALEVLDREIEETWMGISSQTVYIAAKNKMKIAEVPVTVTYGPGTSSENFLAHGLSIAWTLIWTAFAKNPAIPLAAGAAALALSITLFSYACFIFNISRYIRLAYTTLAILSGIVATPLIAVGTALAVTRTRKQT
jgi:glycosyltransferase involved in cell wall biosynthesis